MYIVLDNNRGGTTVNNRTKPEIIRSENVGDMFYCICVCKVVQCMVEIRLCRCLPSLPLHQSFSLGTSLSIVCFDFLVFFAGTASFRSTWVNHSRYHSHFSLDFYNCPSGWMRCDPFAYTAATQLHCFCSHSTLRSKSIPELMINVFGAVY